MSPEAARHSWALTIAYAGRDFVGFQLQNELPTVQRALEKALAVVARQFVRVHPCGRTDSGVHASGQVISFSTTAKLRAPHLQQSLNGLLPKSVRVREVHAVPEDFHARFDCIAREYVYLIQNARVPTPHWEGRAHWLRHPLPLEALNAELALMLGKRDWASFTRAEYSEASTIRYIDVAHLEAISDPTGGHGLVALRVRGNAFLHNMIRILAGSLMERAQSKLSDSLPDIQAALDRGRAGATAPASGLYFLRAYYRPELRATGLACLDGYPEFKARRPGGTPAI